jgi:aspartyl-tRNA(Asn)/glutamyl-tRNA(Gln) amidotransferase subunit A
MCEDLSRTTIAELSCRLESGECSSREITQACLDRIADIDPGIQAFLSIRPDRALAQADLADQRRKNGPVLRLSGIPLGIKDNMCIQDERTTCASKILNNFRPPYTATAVSRLIDEGVVILGKTNMDEFAMGSSCEHSAFQPTRNPWDVTRIPGGSSGGSAAAVAAGLCPGTLGSDTGGSIRQPASLCGVVGMKPTYGRVSRYGLVAFASSLDQIGPFARTVEDAALLCNVICGHDPLDSTSVPEEIPDFTGRLGHDIKGVKIGLPREYFIEGMESGVEQSVRQAVSDLESLGAEVVEISLPHTEYAMAVYYVVATAEASSNLARYDGVQYGYRAENTENIIEMYSKTRSQGFGKEVKCRIMLGTYALSAGFYDAYYLKALKVRTLVRQDFTRAFENVDVIATPTSPMVAFKSGSKLDDPLQMYLCDVLTIPCNLAGIPGISLPCGITDEGLPVGLQLLAADFDEARMFQVAHAYEQSRDWWKQTPDVKNERMES